MRRLSWVVLLAVGCTQSPAERVQTVCNALCDCAGGLPTVIEECVTNECAPMITTVSDECLQCVFDHESTCSDLDTDCTTLCFMQMTN